MSALSPYVEKMMTWRVPKALAITIVYLVVISLLGLLLILVIRPLIEQTSNLTTSLPATLETILPPGTINRNLLEDRLGDFFGNVPNVILTIFSNILAIISVTVLTFYLLIDKKRFERLLSQVFVPQQDRARGIIEKIEEKLGAWLRGQIVLSIVIGTLSYLLLFALGVDYALPLAILAGVMEVVPVIGPIISAIPAVLIAYIINPPLAIAVAVGYFLIQQLENNIIVPQVMKRAVGLNPLVVIVAIAIGGRLLGISGALLAVPITVLVQIIAEELLNLDLGSRPLTKNNTPKSV